MNCKNRWPRGNPFTPEKKGHIMVCCHTRGGKKSKYKPKLGVQRSLIQKVLESLLGFLGFCANLILCLLWCNEILPRHKVLEISTALAPFWYFFRRFLFFIFFSSCRRDLAPCRRAGVSTNVTLFATSVQIKQ